MPLIKKPVTGMKDILPEEMAVRNYAVGVIRDTYEKYGFSPIETPAVEHIENLLSKQGGDNEKLIFKILKRGEKLDIKNASSEEDVTDGGLRYDLTLPLARFYASNGAGLSSPFKAIQIGNVYRADRPQRGRYRQFTQCDIDVLGEPGPVAEIDLILATSGALTALGFKDFTIRINDRALLKEMAKEAGFGEEDYEKVFIIIDKMDKIGRDGVTEELKASFDPDTADRYMSLFEEVSGTPSPSDRERMERVGSPIPLIMETVEKVKDADYKIVYDPTLVRGMGYYTGPIFEISMDEYGGSVGGGGRYDEMIGRFTGQPTPAVGFSIGFERIIMLLLENGFKVPGRAEKTAFLVEKGMPADELAGIFLEAQKMRAAGQPVDISAMKKNRKFQKEQLKEQGVTEIREFFNK